MNLTFNNIPNRARLYYLCQLTGWGAYGLAMSAFSYFYRSPHEISTNELLANAALCLLAFGLTHLFRVIFQRFHWMDESLPRLAAMVIGANFLMSAIYVAATLQLTIWFGLSLDEVGWEDLVLLVVNYMTLFLFWSVIYFAIAFFRRYRQEEIERLQWESALKDFELNKLKSQLNPHFVFNALNGIRSLVDEDPVKSKLAITQLSNILRNSLLSDRARTITFREELKTVYDYLNLEKIRFEERLDFKIELQDETMDIEVPPMMIQTLVENAVKHGISKRVKGGEIQISSKIGPAFAEIRIDNSGILGNTGPEGFGIVNTLHRLELIYNQTGLFSIEQSGPETVSAIIKIPIPSK